MSNLHKSSNSSGNLPARNTSSNHTSHNFISNQIYPRNDNHVHNTQNHSTPNQDHLDHNYSDKTRLINNEPRNYNQTQNQTQNQFDITPSHYSQNQPKPSFRNNIRSQANIASSTTSSNSSEALNFRPHLTIGQKRDKTDLLVFWSLDRLPKNFRIDNYIISYTSTTKTVDSSTTSLRIPITSRNQSTQKNDGAFIISIIANYTETYSQTKTSSSSSHYSSTQIQRQTTSEKLIKTDINFPQLSSQEEELLIQILHRKSDLLKQIEIVRDEIQMSQVDIAAVETHLGIKNDSSSTNNQNFRNIVKYFNKNPEKGLVRLLDSNFIKHDTASDIAGFLFNEDQHDPPICKIAIGEVLGKEKNKEILVAYINLFEDVFNSNPLLPTLRLFLDKFKLPGEAQQIDRIVECFSQLYVKLNHAQLARHIESTSSEARSDEVYILTFATIMLNTTLHNPSVKHRMSCVDFIKMAKTGDRTADYDFSWKSDFLSDIYRDIQAREIMFPSQKNDTVFGAAKAKVFEEPDIEGWLLLMKSENSIFTRATRKTWQKKYCCLSKRIFYYVDRLEDVQPRGIIPIEHLHVHGIPNHQKETNVFELRAADPKTAGIKRAIWNPTKQIHEWNDDLKQTSFRLSAQTEGDKQRWITSLNECLGVDPMYDLIKSRRDRMSNRSIKHLGIHK